MVVLLACATLAHLASIRDFVDNEVMDTASQPTAQPDKKTLNELLRTALYKNNPELLEKAFASGAILPRPGRQHPIFAWLAYCDLTPNNPATVKVLDLLLANGLPPNFCVSAMQESIASLPRDDARIFMDSVPGAVRRQPLLSITQVGAPLLDRLLQQRQSQAAARLLHLLPLTTLLASPDPYRGPLPLALALDARDWSNAAYIIDRIEQSERFLESKGQARKMCISLARACATAPPEHMDTLQSIALWLDHSAKIAQWDDFSEIRRRIALDDHTLQLHLDRWVSLFPDDWENLWHLPRDLPPNEDGVFPRPSTLWPSLLARVVDLGVDDPLWRRAMADPRLKSSLEGVVCVLDAKASKSSSDVVYAPNGIGLSPLDYLVLLTERQEHWSTKKDNNSEEEDARRKQQIHHHWDAAVNELEALGATTMWQRSQSPSPITYAQIWAMRDRYDLSVDIPAPAWWKDHPKWIAPHPVTGRGPIHELLGSSHIQHWLDAGVLLDARDASGNQALPGLAKVLLDQKPSRHRDASLAVVAAHLQENPSFWEEMSSGAERMANLACGHRNLFKALQSSGYRPDREGLRVAVHYAQPQILKVLLARPYSMARDPLFNNSNTLLGEIALGQFLVDKTDKRFDNLKEMEVLLKDVALDPANAPGQTLRKILGASLSNRNFGPILPPVVAAGPWGPPALWSASDLLAMNFASLTAPGHKNALGMKNQIEPELAFQALIALLDPSAWPKLSWPNHENDLRLTDLATRWIEVLAPEATPFHKQQIVHAWNEASLSASQDHPDNCVFVDPHPRLLAHLETFRLDIGTQLVSALPSRANPTRL
jgi:hypothetical protein